MERAPLLASLPSHRVRYSDGVLQCCSCKGSEVRKFRLGVRNTLNGVGDTVNGIGNTSSEAGSCLLRRSPKRGEGWLRRRRVPSEVLVGAISNLSDQEFDLLLAAVLAEQKRRGTKIRGSRNTSRKPASKEIGPPLTLAKLNAVRAAFKAGVARSPGVTSFWQ
jgi:hypothetical protein